MVGSPFFLCLPSSSIDPVVMPDSGEMVDYNLSTDVVCSLSNIVKYIPTVIDPLTAGDTHYFIYSVLSVQMIPKMVRLAQGASASIKWHNGSPTQTGTRTFLGDRVISQVRFTGAGAVCIDGGVS